MDLTTIVNIPSFNSLFKGKLSFDSDLIFMKSFYIHPLYHRLLV